jgi:AraC family transcriptional regulator
MSNALGMAPGSRLCEGLQHPHDEASSPAVTARSPKRLSPGAYHGEGIARGGGVTVSLYGGETELPLHEHAESHVFVILGGGCEHGAPGETVALRPGAAAVVAGGQSHANAFGRAGGFCLNLALPAAMETPASAHASLSPRARGLAERLAWRIVGPAPIEALDVDCAAAEIAGEPVFGDRVRDEPLRRVAGRHPTHLARAFRQRVGLSIGAYRRMRRLRGLCVDLGRGDESLSALAQRHGYFDQAHMTREFTRAFGASPRAWRRR